ncbi:DNA/RNA polymerase [Violaceomyces palustris]|uniref:DNA/RNA polymerase n=1 Tax=Violaceomyces palustris TaxID=1673888 RepID=A0ACD0P0U7_9BASI|nr:DNA/RNA polymerase [Violaceomyces palustris]
MSAHEASRPFEKPLKDGESMGGGIGRGSKIDDDGSKLEVARDQGFDANQTHSGLFFKDPPRVTYRHLLSSSTLNASNPLRVVAHCDVDAAYAQFEASRLGLDPKTVPIAVQQWQGLIAVNYPARDRGISRFETIENALKKCPELRLVHVPTYSEGCDVASYHPDPRPETHKVSLDNYRRESRKIIDIFRSTLPLASVEKASIDESYFDLTIHVRKVMLERYPYLAAVPISSSTDACPRASSSHGSMDTPLPDPPSIPFEQWSRFGHLIPIQGSVGEANGIGRPKPAAAAAAATTNGASSDSIHEEESKDGSSREAASAEIERGKDEGSTTTNFASSSWTEVALYIGAELMEKVREKIRQELGYTTSAGISFNKTLSKLCSGWRKPDSQTILLPRAVENFLRELPFKKIRFLGGKLGEAISNEWSSSTVGDLWSVSLEEMKSKFGQESVWVWNVLRGVDHSEVRERVSNRTMLASKSVRPPITRSQEALHWLGILSMELAIRLNEAREELSNLWPRNLVLRFIKAGQGHTPRSRQIPFPFTSRNQVEPLTESIRRMAEKLWNESCCSEALNSNDSKVVTISLGFSGLVAGEVGQVGLANFLSSSGSHNGVKPKRPPPPGVLGGKDEGEVGKEGGGEGGVDFESGKTDPEMDGLQGKHGGSLKGKGEVGPGLELDGMGEGSSLRPGVEGKGRRNPDQDLGQDAEGEGELEFEWECQRCKEVIQVLEGDSRIRGYHPPASPTRNLEHGSREITDPSSSNRHSILQRYDTLLRLKEEHLDWHLALDLSRGEEEPLATSSKRREEEDGHGGPSSPSKKRRTPLDNKSKPGGRQGASTRRINSFFKKSS